MASPVPDPELGAVFGRWTVTGPTVQAKHKKVPVTCICGVSKAIDKTNLLKGLSQSCGCLAKEVTSALSKTHGKSGTPVYAVWNMMKQRCSLPSNASYPDYGGRGISYDPTWESFEVFYRDMGDPPFPRATLERLDTNGNYCKENCRWASKLEQANNKRNNVLFEYKGQKLSLSKIAKLTGMNQNTLTSRIYGQSLSLEEALAKPITPNEVSGAMAGMGRAYKGRVDGENKYQGPK